MQDSDTDCRSKSTIVEQVAYLLDCQVQGQGVHIQGESIFQNMPMTNGNLQIRHYESIQSTLLSKLLSHLFGQLCACRLKTQ